MGAKALLWFAKLEILGASPMTTNKRLIRTMLFANALALAIWCSFVTTIYAQSDSERKRATADSSKLIREILSEEDLVERELKTHNLRQSALRKYFSKKPENSIEDLKILAELNERYLVELASSGNKGTAIHYELLLIYGRIGKMERLAKRKLETETALRMARWHSTIGLTGGPVEIPEILRIVAEIDEQQRSRYQGKD